MVIKKDAPAKFPVLVPTKRKTRGQHSKYSEEAFERLPMGTRKRQARNSSPVKTEPSLFNTVSNSTAFEEPPAPVLIKKEEKESTV